MCLLGSVCVAWIHVLLLLAPKAQLLADHYDMMTSLVPTPVVVITCVPNKKIQGASPACIYVFSVVLM